MIATASNIKVGDELVLARNPNHFWQIGATITVKSFDACRVFYGDGKLDFISKSFLDDFDIVLPNKDTYLVVCPERGFNCVVGRDAVKEILSKNIDDINKFKIVKNPDFVSFKVNFTVELDD